MMDFFVSEVFRTRGLETHFDSPNLVLNGRGSRLFLQNLRFPAVILPHSSHQLQPLLSVSVRIAVISVSEEQQPSTSTFNLDINNKKKSWFPFFCSFWSSVFHLLWCVLGCRYLGLHLLAFIHVKGWNLPWFRSWISCGIWFTGDLSKSRSVEGNKLQGIKQSWLNSCVKGLKAGICTVEVTEPESLTSQTSSKPLDLALWILSARVTKCADNQKWG